MLIVHNKEQHMTNKTHPVIGGKQTTFVALGEKLGVTGSAAAQKYRRIKQDHEQVTMAMMRAPYVKPDVAAKRAAGLIEREQAEVVRIARLHGATHAAMVHKLYVEDVRSMVARADAQIKAANGKFKGFTTKRIKAKG